MQIIFEQLAELRRLVDARRKGFYVASVKRARQTFRRVQVEPDWLDEGVLDFARRIGSPLLDVIPPVGARVAVTSEDGDPARPAVLGVIWDDVMPALTAWLRADLASAPGRIELGANKSVHICIRSDSGSVKSEFDLEALADGTVKLETQGGELVINADGTIRLGSQATNAVSELRKLAGQLSALCTQIGAGVVPTLLGPQPLTTAPAIATTLKGAVAAIETAVTAIEG